MSSLDLYLILLCLCFVFVLPVESPDYLDYNAGIVMYVYRYKTPPDPHSLFRYPTAKYTDYKTSWPPEPIGHKSWKASRGSSQSQLSRPPPGLASQKQPSPSPWSGGAPRLAGRGWGGGSSTTGNIPTHFSCCFGSNVVHFLPFRLSTC